MATFRHFYLLHPTSLLQYLQLNNLHHIKNIFFHKCLFYSVIFNPAIGSDCCQMIKIRNHIRQTMIVKSTPPGKNCFRIFYTNYLQLGTISAQGINALLLLKKIPFRYFFYIWSLPYFSMHCLYVKTIIHQLYLSDCTHSYGLCVFLLKSTFML